jgi:hypothetical protein
MKSPTAQDKINEPVGVIGVHVSEENRIQSLGPDSEAPCASIWVPSA